MAYKNSSEAVKQRSLAQDNIKTFDASYIEVAIYSLFMIDILNYVKVKSILAKEFHIQPSEIDKLPAWEYELFMKEINNAVKEENERHQAEMDKSGYDNPKYFEQQQRNMERRTMRNMPNMSSFKMPSLPKM
jgi:hypothetical protein